MDDGVNKKAWQAVKKYLNLRIGNEIVPTPYFQNKVGMYFGAMMRNAGISSLQIQAVFKQYNQNQIPYGWYQGKGTPEQIEDATKKISEAQGVNLSKFTADEIRELMKYWGLGIDCSGFVYQVLGFTLGKKVLDKTLDWGETEIYTANKAGSASFAGQASFPIPVSEIRPLDLILRKNRQKKYVHVALMLADGNKLVVAQSSLFKGAVISEFNVAKKDDLLEFRRLKFGDGNI